MIIVSQKEDLFVFTEKLIEINIHSDGKKIIASFENPSFRAMPIGEYENKKQSQRVLALIADAISSGKGKYEMPKSTDPQLNTAFRASGISNRTVHTNGKTK